MGGGGMGGSGMGGSGMGGGGGMGDFNGGSSAQAFQTLMICSQSRQRYVGHAHKANHFPACSEPLTVVVTQHNPSIYNECQTQPRKVL